jgi:hypothetical protein
VLLSAIALTILPHGAFAATSQPKPPEGCASTEKYSGDSEVYIKLTACLTEERVKYAYTESDEPTDKITTTCQEKGVFLYTSASCGWSAKVSLQKDGVTVWTERANSGWHDHYACRGKATYTLVVEDIHAKITDNVFLPTEHRQPKTVELRPGRITVSAKGC